METTGPLCIGLQISSIRDSVTHDNSQAKGRPAGGTGAAIAGTANTPAKKLAYPIHAGLSLSRPHRLRIDAACAEFLP